MAVKPGNRLISSDEHDCIYKVVFCTKYGRKLFNTEDMKAEVREVLSECLKKAGDELRFMRVDDNVVIMELKVHPERGIYKALRQLKRESYPILKKRFPELGTRVPTVWTRQELIFTRDSEISAEDIINFINRETGVVVKNEHRS